MAITKGAKKAIRSAARKKVFNNRNRRLMRNAVKVAKAGTDPKALSAAYAAIDKAVKRGILKKNAAARKKSQLARTLNQA